MISNMGINLSLSIRIQIEILGRINQFEFRDLSDQLTQSKVSKIMVKRVRLCANLALNASERTATSLIHKNVI